MNNNKLVFGLLALVCVSLIGLSASALFGFGKSENKTETKKLKAEETKDLSKVKNPKNPVVEMVTEKGTVKIEVFEDIAPITAGNFLDLVNKHFYDGLVFHRLISGFMIQGGCPKGNGTGNYNDPETGKPRYLKFEYPNASLSDEQKLKLTNKRGRLAMARTSDPNTASSQFFIDLVDNAFLDTNGTKAGYAVFGEVIDGMDVVDKIMSENVPPSPGSDGTSNPVKIKSITVVES